MQCDECHNNTATVHLTEITDGKRYETHLCEECAQKQGIAIKNQIPLNELLSSLLAVQAQAEEPSEDSSVSLFDQACPNCGMTLRKFAKTSLLGCPDDYKVFEKKLKPLIANAQSGRTSHRGKIPSTAPQDTKQKFELINLRQQLDQAVKNEDYETAARLRDRIQKLQ